MKYHFSFIINSGNLQHTDNTLFFCIVIFTITIRTALTWCVTMTLTFRFLMINHFENFCIRLLGIYFSLPEKYLSDSLQIFPLLLQEVSAFCSLGTRSFLAMSFHSSIFLATPFHSSIFLATSFHSSILLATSFHSSIFLDAVAKREGSVVKKGKKNYLSMATSWSISSIFFSLYLHCLES